jgi:hypothetical protein
MDEPAHLTARPEPDHEPAQPANAQDWDHRREFKLCPMMNTVFIEASWPFKGNDRAMTDLANAQPIASLRQPTISTVVISIALMFGSHSAKRVRTECIQCS